MDMEKSNSELLPMPDVPKSFTEFVPLSIAGLHKATALNPDDRHLLMDNLIFGATGEQMKHPTSPSAGYVITWNSLVRAFQEKIEAHSLLSSKGKEGAAKRWNREQTTDGANGGHGEAIGGLKEGHGEAIGGLKGGHGEAIGGLKGMMADSDSDSDIDKEYENEFNNTRETKLNSIQSSSHPQSVQEVMAFANSSKNQWNVTQEEAAQWFEMNDDNQWTDYKTKQPIRNWQGLLKRWLLAERKKKYDQIWADREKQLREKATDYGIDPELDKQWYDAMRQLAALKPRNYEALQEDIRAYEDHYKPNQEGADDQGRRGRKDK